VILTSSVEDRHSTSRDRTSACYFMEI